MYHLPESSNETPETPEIIRAIVEQIKSPIDIGEQDPEKFFVTVLGEVRERVSRETERPSDGCVNDIVRRVMSDIISGETSLVAQSFNQEDLVPSANIVNVESSVSDFHFWDVKEREGYAPKDWLLLGDAMKKIGKPPVWLESRMNVLMAAFGVSEKDKIVVRAQHKFELGDKRRVGRYGRAMLHLNPRFLNWVLEVLKDPERLIEIDTKHRYIPLDWVFCNDMAAAIGKDIHWFTANSKRLNKAFLATHPEYSDQDSFRIKALDPTLKRKGSQVAVCPEYVAFVAHKEAFQAPEVSTGTEEVSPSGLKSLLAMAKSLLFARRDP